MTTRTEFLKTISDALGRPQPATPPVAVPYPNTVHLDVMKNLTTDELAKAFIDYSKPIGADVFETTKEHLLNTIKEAMSTCSDGDVVVADDPLLNELNLKSELDNVRVWDVQRSWDDNVHFAEKAAAGIAVAEMALAESATVLLFSYAGKGRSVTLLPESTIYIIPKSKIKPRLTQGMAHVREQKENMPSSVNFVSGPSATSDIELVRVVGVHGPVHVVHIVVNDL